MTTEPTRTTSKGMMPGMPSLQLSIVTSKEKYYCTSFSAMFCPLHKVTNREHCKKVFYNLSSHNLCKHREAIMHHHHEGRTGTLFCQQRSEIPGQFITFGLGYTSPILPGCHEGRFWGDMARKAQTFMIPNITKWTSSILTNFFISTLY